MNKKFCIFIIILLFFTNVSLIAQKENGWTIMHYAVGSNSSEVDLLDDIGEMMKGKTSAGYEVITLIDRTEGHSEDAITLGENFTDTRLYRLSNNKYEELEGKKLLPNINKAYTYDANMGDANLLKQFIKYCKTHYPAKNYMLVLRSHGNGFAMCPDAESGVMDKLYPGELRDVLTKEESVDILGLDVCSMAGLENLYEWRPDGQSFSADYVIASAPLSGAWAYDQILNRLQTDTNKDVGQDTNHFSEGKEEIFNPYKMTSLEFSKLIIEEIFDNQPWASWGLFDNTKIVAAKSKIDELGRLLADEEKRVLNDLIEKTLGYYHGTGGNMEVAQLAFPYIDAYHFYNLIATSDKVAKTSSLKATEVCKAIDEVVIHSFYGRGFLPITNDFVEGKTGVYQIIPMGNKLFSQTKRSFWSHTSWFHPDDKTKVENSYGLYDWCADGAIRGNHKVDNFFELLDYLFEESNTAIGGVNGYQW